MAGDDGTMDRCAEIALAQDSSVEGPEDFTVALALPTGSDPATFLLGTASSTFTILDGDSTLPSLGTESH